MEYLTDEKRRQLESEIARLREQVAEANAERDTYKQQMADEQAMRAEWAEVDLATELRKVAAGFTCSPRAFQMKGVCLEAADQLQALVARAESAEAKLAALEAQCATKHKALETGVATLKDIQRFQGGLIAPHGDALDAMLLALKGDSGTHLLARLRELEEVAKAATKLHGAKRLKDTVGKNAAYERLRTEGWAALDAALAKVAQQPTTNGEADAKQKEKDHDANEHVYDSNQCLPSEDMDAAAGG